MAKVKSSDDEFKQNAIALAMRGDRSMAAVARELNIPYSRLRGWVDQHKERQSKYQADPRTVELERRVKQLEEENQILKKAAAYFAKNQP